MASKTDKKSNSNNLLEMLQMFAGGQGAAGGMDKLTGILKGEVEIVRRGEEIVIPEGMTYDEAVTWLLRRKSNDETEVEVVENVAALPLDGAVAFSRVLERTYGFVSLVTTPTFFGPQPPVMVSVPTGPGPGDMIQVPWGRMNLPGVDGYVETGATITDNRPVFRIYGNVKRVHEKRIHDLATEVRALLEKESIYRGKAIRVEFHEAGKRDNPFDEKFAPKFLDLSKPTNVILNADAEARLEVELYNVVKYTERCKHNHIPLKRGVLLEGPYGTGKTLTAYALAKACTDNGWTFIYLSDAALLDKALGFARLYQPCVIFAEDIDKVIENTGDHELVTIRNALDSIETKYSEIMVVLTTNNLHLLHAGFLRCGRIDSIVTIGRPDLEATVKLARLYGGKTIVSNDDELKKALAPLAGQSAAVIREAVERAKLAAVSHADETTGAITISAADLQVTSDTLANHTKLLNKENAKERTHPANPLIKLLGKYAAAVCSGENPKLEELACDEDMFDCDGD